jgi:hypothetical protein
MSKSNLHETDYLKLVFQNIAIANIGDASGLQPSATTGSLYVALYTTNPGEDDSGTEAVYTGYARQAVVRSAAGWTVSGNVVSNAALITYPTSTGSDETITHFAVRTASTGGDLIGSGALNSSLLVQNGDTPKFQIGDITINED